MIESEEKIPETEISLTVSNNEENDHIDNPTSTHAITGNLTSSHS